LPGACQLSTTPTLKMPVSPVERSVMVNSQTAAWAFPGVQLIVPAASSTRAPAGSGSTEKRSSGPVSPLEQRRVTVSFSPSSSQ
jgi:hypothetical protein